ncbi:transcription termination factor 1 [Rhinichthys klamathensis goyatoka]|uniref:transcription termination factor 1 n=1 Tax=Rhinichthys klamathensis goyatoka TaxID=3034132 RepID=UPI0024B521AC|nr:transcription termination factor 1 [Rhinichthys klamathensis goyatoka]
MDEMQSDSRNNIKGRFNEQTVKKKRKKNTNLHELTESSKVQTEKQNEKKHKKTNTGELENISLQTHTVKKKKRKLNEGGEVVIFEEASMMDGGVTSLHQVKDMKTPTAESQELKKKKRSSTEEKSDKAKKKRENATEINCDHMAQEQESGLPAVLTGTLKRRKKKNRLEEPLVDPNLLNELKEFCPKIESRDPSEINKMIVYDLPRFREFRKQGIMLRHGRFSNAENEMLRQNVSDFMALTGVKDATKLFHPKMFPEEKWELTKLKKVYRFFERIADGIPRSCHDVFTRGTKVFDGRNYKGRFSKEEIKALLKYHTLHGSNWRKISELTGRSSFSLEKRFSQISYAKKRGLWSVKEEQRLLRAVRDHIVTVLKSESPNNTTPKRVSREMLYQKLPWFNIALKVKTRCWSKCREKWLNILAVRMSSGTLCRGRKAQEAKIRLIKAMYQTQVEDVTDVDWDDLTAVFGDVPPAHVQAKWHQLKVCYVPDWKAKCFGDIVDFLYEKILPGLEKDCEDLDDNELKVEQKQSFRISDIFQDINEDDCCDSDEESGQKEDNT